MSVIPRPAADEATPYFHGYIAQVEGENVSEQLADQVEEIQHLFQGVDDRSALERYAPGKWSIKEILGHLADVERIFAYRLLRISRGDQTPLPSFDENAYVPAGQFDARPVGSLLDEFIAVRRSTQALVGGIPAGRWASRGEAGGNVISARALAYIMVGHVTHHLGVLRERYRLGQSMAHR
jgi:hypothetical protein